MIKQNSLNISNPTIVTKLTDAMRLKDISNSINGDKRKYINVILLGDKCVGKTSIVYQFISNKFDQYYIQTIMKEEFSKVIDVNGKKFNINFIVTAGVPEYQEDYTNWYKVSDFFLVCYEISNVASFEKAKEIISNKILPYVFLHNDRFANIVLLGNKCDLRDKAVDHIKVNEYCKKYNIYYIETSAKTKTNIAKIFNKIAEVYDEAIGTIATGQ